MMRLHRLALLLGSVVAFAGCGDSDPAESPEGGVPEPGGTAVVAALSDFQTFNEIINTGAVTGEIIRYMLFTPLIQLDGQLTPQPYLAESWELSDTSVTFHLRSDIRWHDGRPVTADDVKFTFDLAKDPASASLLGAAYLTMVESATVVDSLTVHFRFSAPHAQALEDFWWGPVPQHLLQGVAAADLPQTPFNFQPVGSGPFRFVSWARGQSLTLERNPDFPEALGGPPNLERVVFRVIPEQTTIITEVLSGTLDAIVENIQPEQATQIESQESVELMRSPSRSYTYIGWNNERPKFDDAGVRRALTMAINRPALIEAILHGYGVVAEGMVPPLSPMFTPLDPLPYDPEAARQLISQAGWRDSNGDGIVERDGAPFELILLVSSASRTNQDVATVVQQQLRQVGVDVEIQAVEFQAMIRQHRAREYDGVIANWTLDTFKIDPTPLFSCVEAGKPQSANRAGYCNPRGDSLIEQGLRTTDPAAAKLVWADFQRLLQEDQPITFLYWREDLTVVGRRLRGVEADARARLITAAEWWIPASLRD